MFFDQLNLERIIAMTNQFESATLLHSRLSRKDAKKISLGTAASREERERFNQHHLRLKVSLKFAARTDQATRIAYKGTLRMPMTKARSPL